MATPARTPSMSPDINAVAWLRAVSDSDGVGSLFGHVA